MKNLFLIGITSLVLFALSASGSYFWQQKMKNGQAKETETHKDKETVKPGTGAAQTNTSHGDSVPKAAARPAYNANTEEIARMTTELRMRLAAVREREDQLTARKKQLDMLQEDIRGERTALDDLRTQVKNEMEALNEAIQGVEKKRGSLDEERQKISKSTKEMEGRLVQLQKDEQDNLKKMSGMYNSMSPESAAKILQNLADTGKLDTAVKVLGLMQDRQAAKVLAELTDAGLAAQMVEKLKNLRRAPNKPDANKQ
ncbi:MAG: hypothetical protein ACRELG_22990 [Gemmataceae bacterium]